MGFTTGTGALASHVGRYGAAPPAAHAGGGLSAGDRALDVGCGPGALLGELAGATSGPFVALARGSV